MKVVKKITNMALANDWMEKDPFINIRFHEQEVHKEFLTKEELETMQNKVFDVPRLDLVRDIFLFRCFTVVALMCNLLYINEVQGEKTKLVTI